MRLFSRPPTLWKIWLGLASTLIALALLPISNLFTRLGSIVILIAALFVLTALVWRRPWLRFGLLAIHLLIVVFLVLPARKLENTEILRSGFLAGLRRYEGVRYFWGGECFTGIDCSGLVRRGLIDSLFVRGIRTFDPGLVRHALWLWWHDCSASDLGDGKGQLTIPVLETPSINALDHSRLIPGDLAVTRGGEHVMAYLGSNLWIEADPVVHRVITVSVPSQTNAWFQNPMRIVRWRILK